MLWRIMKLFKESIFRRHRANADKYFVYSSYESAWNHVTLHMYVILASRIIASLSGRVETVKRNIETMKCHNEMTKRHNDKQRRIDVVSDKSNS